MRKENGMAWHGRIFNQSKQSKASIVMPSAFSYVGAVYDENVPLIMAGEVLPEFYVPLAI
jgi:hypothetical protein